MDQRLESFLKLCETMHYGKAAEELNITQPAVSKHIQSIENEYGVKLFKYANRRLVITREGVMLQRYVQSLKYNEEALIEKLHEPKEKLLRIGATKSIGEYVLLPYIKRFLDAPDNRIEFIVDNTAHLLDLLNTSRLDFVVLEGLFDKQRYDTALLRNEPYIGICAKNHPFAGKQVAVDDLLKEPIILREEGSGTRKIFEKELSNLGYTVEVFQDRVFISSFEIIKELVKNNYGISFVYESVVKNCEHIGVFHCPPLTGIHEFNIVYLKNTEAGKASELFFTEQKKEIKDI